MKLVWISHLQGYDGVELLHLGFDVLQFLIGLQQSADFFFLLRLISLEITNIVFFLLDSSGEGLAFLRQLCLLLLELRLGAFGLCFVVVQINGVLS